jgi:GDP-D-mannose 3',5'-epimerase
MYISDCLKGTQMLLWSDFVEPINIGSNELVSINQLVDAVEQIAGVKLKRNYNLSAPKGRERTKRRQYAHQKSVWLGTQHAAPGWNGKDLSLDL